MQFFHYFLATSMTNWAQMFTDLLFLCICWDTPSENTGHLPIPNVSSPFNVFLFSFAIQMWDFRWSDKVLLDYMAHNGPAFSLDWHPEDRNLIATCGRDRLIKVKCLWSFMKSIAIDKNQRKGVRMFVTVSKLVTEQCIAKCICLADWSVMTGIRTHRRTTKQSEL